MSKTDNDQENDDARLKAALKLQAERWVASHEG
jgi:hypothetical protein